MSKRRDWDYLNDITEAIQRIVSYIDGLTFEKFLHDAKTQDAVVRNLQVIGEATKKLSAALRNSHKEVPWKKLAGVRDKMVHFYFGIIYEIVWEIATVQLPALLPQLDDILAKEKPNSQSK
ncbi:MAG TPA: DUF86 domain-containing protein [bacterium]